jgi:L-fuconolactonase
VLIESTVVNAELALDWREIGGSPRIAPPGPRGFGAYLADRVVTGQFGGRMARDWSPTGLTIRLRLPLDRLTAPGRQPPCCGNAAEIGSVPKRPSLGEEFMPDFPIIDAHVHLTDVKNLGYAWTKSAPVLNRSVLPADLFKAAAPVEIEKFVFVEVDVDMPQHVAEAEWIDGIAKSEPKLAGMVAALPLEQGNAVAGDLARIAGLKVARGIRRLIQNQPDPDFCIQPKFIEGLKLLAKHDLVFDICIFHHHLPNAIKMVRQCPEVRFVLDHIAKPAIKAGLSDPWRQHMKELAALPNVTCKISGVSTEADHKNWTRRAAETLYRPRHRHVRFRALHVWR